MKDYGWLCVSLPPKHPSPNPSPRRVRCKAQTADSLGVLQEALEWACVLDGPGVDLLPPPFSELSSLLLLLPPGIIGLLKSKSLDGRGLKLKCAIRECSSFMVSLNLFCLF